MKPHCTLILTAFLLAGCSLAEDVTPPPALATAQAAQPLAAPTAARPAPTQAVEAAPALPPSNPDPLRGALIYAEDCEPCHGPSGRGDGSMAANIDNPPLPLGEAAFAASVKPQDWFQVVTEGRMDRFMPPFRGMSEAQRWDVVAYALTMSTPPEMVAQGEEVYLASCADCHGEDGRGGRVQIDLTRPELFAAISLESYQVRIAEGSAEMPAFGESLSEEDLQAVAAFTRSLAFASDREQPLTDETAQVLGTIRVRVTNGTQGAEVPEGLEVTLLGFDGDQPALQEVVAVGPEGEASLEDVEAVPGRIFGALVEYQGVPYFSSGGHLPAEDPQLELGVTIYETTPDTDQIEAQRLHLIFDFSAEGLVEVSELWLLGTEGDRTVAARSGQLAIPIRLPEGFANLQFADATPGRFTPTPDGFVLHEPVVPGASQEVIFSFTLPYERRLDFVQPVDYRVRAVVALTEEGAPELRGEGLEDLGTQPMGEFILHSYTMGSLEPGESLELMLRGRHPAAQTTTGWLGWVLGGVALIAAGAAIALIWRRAGRPEEDLEAEAPARAPEADARQRLLQALASLDDALEAGEIDAEEHAERRAALKAEILELMKDLHD